MDKQTIHKVGTEKSDTDHAGKTEPYSNKAKQHRQSLPGKQRNGTITVLSIHQATL